MAIIAPSSSVQDAIVRGSELPGFPGFGLPGAINGQPINPPASVEPPPVDKSIFESIFFEPFKYVAGTVTNLTGYVIAPVAAATLNGVETINTVTDDPSGTWEAYAKNFLDAQEDVKAVTEKVIAGAVPFSGAIGKVFANPLTTLGLVALILALWFIGPVIKRVGA